MSIKEAVNSQDSTESPGGAPASLQCILQYGIELPDGHVVWDRWGDGRQHTQIDLDRLDVYAKPTPTSEPEEQSVDALLKIIGSDLERKARAAHVDPDSYVSACTVVFRRTWTYTELPIQLDGAGL